MFKHKVLLGAILLPLCGAAVADEKTRAKLADIGTNLAKVMGAAEYCGTSAQPLVDAMARGLPHFKLNGSEAQAVLAAIEEHRKQARAQTAQTLSNQACPDEVRKKTDSTLQELENMWYRVVQNETGVDLRQAPASPRPPAASAPTQDGNLCTKGNRISALYAGSWYPAKVLDGPSNTGTCLISYDGFGSNWDEWVNASRMRPVAREPQVSGQHPPPTPAASTTVQTGKYNCYTFDNGQLNYAYTDVQILQGGRYAVGSKEGNYTLSEDGALRFTGTMENAIGKYSIKRGGKPQIDLVFNDDARASMTCPRAK